MTAAPLLILTTRLPPEVCGIGTYSWLVHCNWPAESRDVRFLVIEGAARSAAELQFAAISEFGGQPSRLSAMLDDVGVADLLLHYAGRAYHRYGCPFWLPSVLRTWKRKFSASRILTFFHELPGNFPITSRFYWIDQGNRRIVRRLAELSDAVATNTREHARVIERISGRADVHLVPVGSNIHPGATSAGPKQKTEFAIFGLPFGRWQTLEMFERPIAEWQKTGRLTKLHLIGVADEKFDRRSKGVIGRLPRPDTIVHHGFLPAGEISTLLGRVQFGLTNATFENWSKSSTFMAYAAHGCAIVGNLKTEAVPLNLTFSPDELFALSEADLNTRASRFRQWYGENASWSSIAVRIEALLPRRTATVRE